jgi:hypothetical protein
MRPSSRSFAKLNAVSRIAYAGCQRIDDHGLF